MGIEIRYDEIVKIDIRITRLSGRSTKVNRSGSTSEGRRSRGGVRRYISHCSHCG